MDPIQEIAETLRSVSKRIRKLETKAYTSILGPEGFQYLRQLLDVSIPTPSNNQVLTFDSALNQWISKASSSGVSNLYEMLDVNIPTPSSDQVLTFDSGTSKWISKDPTGGIADIDGIWVYDSVGHVVDLHPATSVGLEAAISSFVSGQSFKIPACTITGDHSIPAGAHIFGVSRFGSVLTGTISLGTGASLENVSVLVTTSSSSTESALNFSSSGTSFVSNCLLSCNQSGSGDSFGALVGSTGTLEVWNSSLEGISAVGNGYGGGLSSGVGRLFHYGGRSVGSTSPYTE